MDEQDKELPAGMPEQIEPDGVLAEPQPQAAETTGEAYTDVQKRAISVMEAILRDHPGGGF